MFSLAIIFITAVLLFVALRVVLAKTHLSLQHFTAIYLLSAFGLFLIYFGLSGRLHWIFALAGGALPFLGTLLRYSFSIFRTYSIFRNLAKPFSTMRTKQKPGQISEIKTVYLAMVLNHDSGDLDGEVLLGEFEGQRLSVMNQDQLVRLLKFIEQDQDSVNVLITYLDRTYPDWQSEPASSSSDELDEEEALKVLGLEKDASKQDIIAAHRRLIQKVHPDRGGTTYLAIRINEAKALLLKTR